MASRESTDIMAKQLPPEFTDLAKVVRNGRGYWVNVIGSVVDFMRPAQSRGTDFQMTFTICDDSTLTNGLRIKYFKKKSEEFPNICDIGDVVLLRNVKISEYANQILGISSYQTQHVVFPKDSIVAPEFRYRYAVRREFLNHTKSPGSPDPDIHEQQWVISLKAYLGTSSEQRPPIDSAPTAAVASIPHHTQSSVVHGPPTPVQRSSVREKFSLIRNVTGGDRDGGSRFGNFYDLAGEVVKMFFDLSHGVLELDFTDYTVNNMLPDRKSSSPEASEGNRWSGPSGKMTLHVELYPPHATWAHENIKAGDFVYLQNVRIKWNARGLGNELEGNIWADKLHPDRVSVSRLGESHPRHSEIQARKTSYLVNVKGKESKLQKRKRKQAEKNSKRPKLTNVDGENGMSPIQSDQENESETDERSKNVESLNEEPADGPADTRSKLSKELNPNVKCLFPDVPLSSFDTIVYNKKRLVIRPNGKVWEAPFINVKHRARLRVIDYYPHELKDFTRLVPDENDPERFNWEWHFCLVLEDGDPDEEEPAAINVMVGNEHGEDLLQIIACDLSRNPRRLTELEQTLFLLWGELSEQKAKFLHAHPQIKADTAFSARKYNIKTDNRVFDTCIEEWGLLETDESGQKSYLEKSWRRIFGLFGTRIKR